MNALYIFYDDRCGLCSRFRHWMQGQPAWVRLEFVPYNSAEAHRLCPGIESMRADEEIVVMADDGRLWQGAGAWITCLWALYEYREWSARLANPVWHGMMRRVVHWISGHRIGLSRLLRLKSDDALRAAVQDSPCESGACGM
jgi:predicted DCC family thiol-disulfide oxidoreductase YuxK